MKRIIILLLTCTLAVSLQAAKKPKADVGIKYLDASFKLYDSLQKQIFNFAETGYKEFRSAEHDRRIEAIHEKVDARKAEREERLKAIHAEIEARKARKEQLPEDRDTVRALPVSGLNEAKEIRELAEDLERDARTAAMAADVPTIHFPEEDEKYYSSRKYGYC